MTRWRLSTAIAIASQEEEARVAMQTVYQYSGMRLQRVVECFVINAGESSNRTWRGRSVGVDGRDQRAYEFRILLAGKCFGCRVQVGVGQPSTRRRGKREAYLRKNNAG